MFDILYLKQKRYFSIYILLYKIIHYSLSNIMLDKLQLQIKI
jgi:hypothetical protein